MEFLGFDIYLVIVVIAAVLVGSIMFFMTKTIGRKPKVKKQAEAAGKNKKLTGLKPRPALKAPAKKSAVTPVARPALKKRAVVPVAAGSKEAGEEQEDSLSLETAPEGKGQAARAAKAKGKPGKPAEYNEDFGSMQVTEETEESASQIVGEENLDQPMDEIGEPENSMDQEGENNPEQADGPIENEGDPSPASAPTADLLGLDKKETEEDPKPEGGLLDLFEEEEDEDSGNSMLASKLEDVDSKSLEEIGKEISQSLFSKY